MAKISRLENGWGRPHRSGAVSDALNGYLHPEGPVKVEFLAQRNILPKPAAAACRRGASGMTTFYPSGTHAPAAVDSVDRLTDTDMDLLPGESAEKPIRPHSMPVPSAPKSRRNCSCRQATS